MEHTVDAIEPVQAMTPIVETVDYHRVKPVIKVQRMASIVHRVVHAQARLSPVPWTVVVRLHIVAIAL